MTIVGYILTAFLCFETVLQTNGEAIISRVPVHTAIRAGTSGRLNCTIDLRGTTAYVFKWSRAKSDGQSETIWSNMRSDRNPIFPGYRLIDGSDFDMEITNPTVGGTFARTYTCDLTCPRCGPDRGGEHKVSAKVLVLDPPRCSNSLTTDATIGQIVEFTCQFKYKGFMKPTTRWFWQRGELDIKDESKVNNEFTESEIKVIGNVTAEAEHDQQTFRCDVTFTGQAPGGRAAPIYFETCSTTIRVRHKPSKPEIAPSPEPDVVKVRVGESVNCSARANPPAEYNWWELKGLGVEEDRTSLPREMPWLPSSILPVTEKLYRMRTPASQIRFMRCVAYNGARDSDRSFTDFRIQISPSRTGSAPSVHSLTSLVISFIIILLLGTINS